jgi:hypothetical protein
MKPGSNKKKPRRTKAEVGKTHKNPLLVHIKPFFNCGQMSLDPQQVRAKRNPKDMAATVAKTQKEDRYFTQWCASGLQ